jgi:hypothetical protein
MKRKKTDSLLMKSGYLSVILAFFFAFPQLVPNSAAQAATENYLVFSINVQDFAYPEQSIATVRRLLDIHERYSIPVDFYLTTTMTDLYEEQAPDLIPRLLSSPVASVSYHVRPPNPYYTGFDWLGLAGMSYSQQYTTIMNYETHGLDLATGQTTGEPGGYQKLKDKLGYAPWVAAKQSDAAVGQAVSDVFKTLGAKFFVVHGRASNLGDRQDGVYIRPEHYDLKLFEHVGEKPKTLIKNAFASAQQAEGARAPYFVGVKMHDNDFFAVDSAWVMVYVNGPRRPPFDISKKSPLLSDAEQQSVWNQYESTVSYAASKNKKYTSANAPMIWEMLEGSSAPPSTTTLYLSGTMHIESNRASWPNADALIAFFARATAAGKVGAQTTAMRWSVGADTGWLTGEPRAAEVIRATEAMGVEWDVHAHEHADRANCYARITQLGGHPNHVTSGLIYTEIDALRSPVAGSGVSWQAEVLWGIVRQPNHGPGSDDNAIGVWRPTSSARWTEHDASGNLIAVGGGDRGLQNIEAFVAIVSGQSLPPVLSATVMVSPRTLTVVNTTDDIADIEAWAARIGASSAVRWANIRETAAAWVAAGSVASRIENWTN